MFNLGASDPNPLCSLYMELARTVRIIWPWGETKYKWKEVTVWLCHLNQQSQHSTREIWIQGRQIKENKSNFMFQAVCMALQHLEGSPALQIFLTLQPSGLDCDSSSQLCSLTLLEIVLQSGMKEKKSRVVPGLPLINHK